ncbi:UNVERIFIED_ORG: phosphatidylethanolamine-binding protein (PEBP) family uncharacterized protein [Rhizobium pisi]
MLWWSRIRTPRAAPSAIAASPISRRSGLNSPKAPTPHPEQAPRFFKNDFGNARYDGPQPPAGDRPHHYIFRLAALDVPKLSIPDAAGISAMWAEAKKHALAEATVTGTYQTQ